MITNGYSHCRILDGLDFERIAAMTFLSMATGPLNTEEIADHELL